MVDSSSLAISGLGTLTNVLCFKEVFLSFHTSKKIAEITVLCVERPHDDDDGRFRMASIRSAISLSLPSVRISTHLFIIHLCSALLAVSLCSTPILCIADDYSMHRG